MAKAGNVVMDAAMEYLIPVLTGALASLPPAETTTSKARVVDAPVSSADPQAEEETAPAEQKTMNA